MHSKQRRVSMSKKYVVVYKCRECRTELTWDEKMYSHGVCPYCGTVSGGTVVDTIKTSRKEK